MAVTITGVKRESSVDLSSSTSGLVLSFVERYTVVTDNPAMLQWEVMRDAVPDVSTAPYLPVAGLPLPGVTVSLDGITVCKSLGGERSDDDTKRWEFVAEWSSEVEENSGSEGDSESNPEAWVPVRETMMENYTHVEIKDKDGVVYKNGAGHPLGTYPEVEDELLRWDFAQFEPLTVTDELISLRHRSINSAAYLGKAKHTLQLKVRRSVVGFYYGSKRRLTEYSLIWKPDTWLYIVANVGPTFRVDDKSYPYIYEGDKESAIVENGPLGIRNVNFADGQTLNDEDGEPSGGYVQDGTDDNGDPIYRAVKRSDADAPIFYFSHRRHDQLDFSSFLRL